MTPQDIRDRNLEKALFNGYDMGAVDRLREECAEALASREKEIATLKGKMKVLVDSIEEYRATEDEMRRALLQAKSRADEIISDAQAKADQIIADAEHYAKEAMADADAYSQRTIGGLQQAKTAEEEKLLNAQTATVRFIEEIRGMCMTQLDYLDTIAAAQRDELPPEAVAAAEAELEAETEAEAAKDELPLVEVKAEQLPESEEEQPLDGQLVLGDTLPETEPVELQADAVPADDATQMFRITSD